jgi:AcrR family transcriptional regulator
MTAVTDIAYHRVMGRWEPNARERLFLAALELYAERGFEQTTVAEIARRAGLTERTFFRHFPDKREVLFTGSDGMVGQLAEVIARAPRESLPLGAVAEALGAVARPMQERREGVLARQKVVAAHAELRERELVKRSKLVAGTVEALEARGVGPRAARLSAEVALGVFHVAFERWVGAEGETRELPDMIAETFAELREVAVGGGVPAG